MLIIYILIFFFRLCTSFNWIITEEFWITLLKFSYSIWKGLAISLINNPGSHHRRYSMILFTFLCEEMTDLTALRLRCYPFIAVSLRARVRNWWVIDWPENRVESKKMSWEDSIEVTSHQCKLSKGKHLEGNTLQSSLCVHKQSSLFVLVGKFYWKQMGCDLHLHCYTGYTFLS